MAVLRRELGLEAKIWLLTVVVAAAAVGAYLGLVEPLGTGPSELDVPWWLVAAGFAAAERWVVHLHFRRSTHSLSLGELPLVARPALPPGARARDRRAGGLVDRAGVRPRDPHVQGVLQPRPVHARHVRGALRRGGARDGARPARSDRLGRDLRRGVRGHPGRRHLRRRGRDDRRGQARAASAHRHADDELDGRPQQHLPRARDRGGGLGAAGGRAAARAADDTADGRLPRVPVRAPAQRRARVPVRGHAYAVALVRDRAGTGGASGAHRLGIPCQRRGPGALLRRAEPLGPLLARSRRQSADARAD